ncbi:MAG: hypothetical protein ACQESX_11690 [Bacteroidota bacterium]
MLKHYTQLIMLAGILLGIFSLSGCLKTKNCNLEVTPEERAWFPYDTTDLVKLETDSGNVHQLTFSEVYEFADDEVSEEVNCQSGAVFYVNLTDTAGNTNAAGQYLLHKKESGDGSVLRSSITWFDLNFYQNNLDDEALYLSTNGNPLEVLDTISIGDSLHENVLHISADDTARLSYSQFKDIYFSEQLEILRYDIRGTNKVFEMVTDDEQE